MLYPGTRQIPNKSASTAQLQRRVGRTCIRSSIPSSDSAPSTTNLQSQPSTPANEKIEDLHEIQSRIMTINHPRVVVPSNQLVLPMSALLFIFVNGLLLLT